MEENKETYDIVDVIGRSYRIRGQGCQFKCKNKNIRLTPIQTTERIYNSSNHFVIFATSFGTYIIPYFFGIEEILLGYKFQKDEEIFVPSELIPAGGFMVLSEWFHMINVINHYNYEKAKERIISFASSKNFANIPLSILQDAVKIPEKGIWVNELKGFFYPMASNHYPFCDLKKVGLFNIVNRRGILYANDGNTYILNTCSEFTAQMLEELGYHFSPKLFVPEI